MQVLYDNYDKYIESSDISNYLKIDESSVIKELDNMVLTKLVESNGSKYKLSEKGYKVAYQRSSSYCPHL